jgi:hypothetical protein
MPTKKPAPKRQPKQDDPEQSKLFVDMARERECDESGEEFRKALKRIAPQRAAAKPAKVRGA